MAFVKFCNSVNYVKNDDEVLVRVDGVGKKFCRSLKKSLWYGVCDIAGELLPGRKRQRVAGSELRVAGENTSAEGENTRHQLPVTPAADHAAWDDDLREGEFYAVKDVSFELRRGELRTPGRSEKEISKKCLGATKVPDSGRRRHQCLGLIGGADCAGGGIQPDFGRTGEPKGWEACSKSNRRLA